MKCPTCGFELNEKVSICPNCGAGMEDDSIRKRWNGLQIYRVLLESGDFTEDSFTLTVRRK